MIATLPSSLMRALPCVLAVSTARQRARASRPGTRAARARRPGVRDEEVVPAREELHGGAAERAGGRPEAGLVHDPAGGAAQHDRRAAAALEPFTRGRYPPPGAS